MRLSAFAFALATGLAGVTGVLIALVFPAFNPFSGAEYSIIGFIVVVLGGLGNPDRRADRRRASSASPSRLATVFLPQAMAQIVGFLILVGTILFRPSGILGVPGRSDDRRPSKSGAYASASAAWSRSTASTLQAAAGEVLGIIGVNGAGKTTLMNCICGIYRADDGGSSIAGADITGLPPHVIAHRRHRPDLPGAARLPQDVADRQPAGAGARSHGQPTPS